MKRSILAIFLITWFFSLSAVPILSAAAGKNIILDGIPTILLPAPFEQNSELMVPIRMMAEAMGAAISWDGETKTIHGNRQDRNFDVRLDNLQGSINGQTVTLPCPVQLINQQSYVPLRFLCEALETRWTRNGTTTWIYDSIYPNPIVYFSFVDTPALHFLTPPEAGQGEYLSMYLDNIEPEDIVTLQTNLDHKAEFFPSGTGRLLLLPISCAQIPGTYFLKVEVQREVHTYLWANEIIRVVPRTFPTQYLTVSAQTAAQRGADMWALDEPFWERGLANSAGHPLWTGTFIQPAAGNISTEFGAVRTVNQEAPTRHSGLDIAVPAGTPVQASQAGMVSLAMPLNVTGNTVFIDHGCQLFSMYYHLSRIAVQEGQVVKTGDLIGEVGSTGFSTGPHLHWAIQLNGVYMNPALFVNPDTAPIPAPDEIGSAERIGKYES